MMKAVASLLLVMCCVAFSHAWTCEEGPRLNNAVQIDAGNGMVVGRDRYNQAYFLIRQSWYSMSSTLFKHVTVGNAGIWAVSTSNRVYKYVGGNFVQANGVSMLQVDAGGAGQVTGVSTSLNTSYCLRSTYAKSFQATSTLSWTSLSTRMKYISCSLYGCWGIDIYSRVYYRQITPNTCTGGSWRQISHVGTPNMIKTSDDGTLFYLTTDGKIYQRTGISSGRPDGTGWTLVSMCMAVRHLTYDLGKLWVVTTGSFLLRCTH